MIEDYFVEIFFWSVIPKKLLYNLEKLISKNNISKLIDPCCGNAFHGYLFNKYLQLETINIDLQDEPYSWMTIIKGNGLEFISNLKKEDFINTGLILSWIDYESLGIDLVNKYLGNLIISIGNYENLSPKYLEFLNTDFNLDKSIILEMPWNLTEKIEVYSRKNI